jgi:hypothetical protein
MNRSLKEDGECVLSRSKPVLFIQETFSVWATGILCESLREILINMLDETSPHAVKIWVSVEQRRRQWYERKTIRKEPL